MDSILFLPIFFVVSYNFAIFAVESAHIDCEFFWCKGGWGVGGPAGGVETFFTLKKTDEWKTFKMNMVDAWNKGWWGGDPGAVVRFDIGDGAGETVVIRLMHWRAAEEGE